MSKPFIHLHVHTEFSLLDGAARLQKGKSNSPLLEACLDMEMPGIAITDHGSMYGAFTFQKMAIERGLKPIIGCEFYICDNMYERVNNYYHILLLAKDDDGYTNLVKMNSMSYIDGFYYKPRIDMELLKKHSKGIICTSACIGGNIPQYLLAGDYEKAIQFATELKSCFAEGDFYIEVQDHGIPEEKKVNPLLAKVAREVGCKLVASNDVHYVKKSDAKMHDVLLCIQTGKLLTDNNRMKFSSDEFYLKSREEMEKLFAWCPEALDTPYEIMEKCTARIVKHNLMPPYTPDDNSLPEVFLRKITYEGLSKRYKVITEEIKERVEYELDVITRMGFCEYYLIVWDFIEYARNHDIPVGAGRGSGVGSIVAYSVGITNVDPLRYTLLFERFLNHERVSSPDFDIDFCVEGRGEVIKYVIAKYGSEKVCQILALGTMATKNAIKDVARVYNIPLSEVNRLTKLIPGGKVKLEYILGLDNEHMSEAIPELIEAYKSESMHEVLDIALQLEGMPRNCSKHAAGVVICKEVISDFVPLCKTGDDITTQFQKGEVEEIGMLKMDFLGLRTLTDIYKAKKYIYENTGVTIDFDELGYDDPKVFDLLCTGETDAVFQLESAGMKKFMKDLRPRSLEDIIAGISLYRPGPMDSIPKYVESKNEPSKIRYDDKLLEPLLNMTYGCIVYQEQVMQIVQHLSGYSLGRADILRRAMGKKNTEAMKNEKNIFVYGQEAQPAVYNNDGSIKSEASPAVDGAIKRGVSEEAAIKIFNDMESFAKYAFNKSHAAAYAVVAYETAYLKCYYPVQFITAVINNRITNADEVAKYVEYMRESGVEVRSPHINLSDVYFACEDGCMRFGLMGIKNVGEAAITAVVNERKNNGEYKSLSDFLKRISDFSINKRMIECLIKAGVLDCFGHNRATLLANYESELLVSSYDKKARATGQFSMFNMEAFENSGDDLRVVKDFPLKELLLMEKEVLNIYMSGHPLDAYRALFAEMPFTLNNIKPIMQVESGQQAEEEDEAFDTAELVKTYDNQRMSMGGMIVEVRVRVTKTNKSMAICKVEDLYGAIEVVFFPRSYDKYKHIMVKDNIVMVSGVLQVSGRPQIVADCISAWGNENDVEEVSNIDVNIPIVASGKKLYINLMGQEEKYDELVSVLKFYNGKGECYVQMMRDGAPKLFKSPCNVQECDNLLVEIDGIIGENNCKLI